MPNVYDYAKSELSHDASLCWLAAWAEPSHAKTSPSLHAAGKQFVRHLMSASGLCRLQELMSIRVLSQRNSIDVLIIVNGTIALVIENKVGTIEHDQQLVRYRDLILEKYGVDNVGLVYVQMHEQSSYAQVRASGYCIVNRSDLIELTAPAAKAAPHSVAHDLHEHLVALDAHFKAWKTTPIEEGQDCSWTGKAWIGFFVALQHRFGFGHWGRVTNRGGSFYAMWMHGKLLSSCELYLQLSEDRLAFRISGVPKGRRSSTRNSMYKYVLRSARLMGLEVAKPMRFGVGETMEVAHLEKDYRVANDSGVIDLAATVQVIRQAIGAIDAITETG